MSHGGKTVHCYIQMHLDKIINPSRRRKLAGTYDPSPGPRMSHRVKYTGTKDLSIKMSVSSMETGLTKLRGKKGGPAWAVWKR